MEDAIKNTPLVPPGIGRPDNNSTQKTDTEAAVPEGSASAGTRKKDRWFVEERGGKKVAKRLNIINEAQVNARGPLKLTGNITLTDEGGQESFHNELVLCRCGASGNKPLCDGQHLEIEFFDNGSIMQASRSMVSRTPQPLHVQLIKDGPLVFRGYLRVFNARGQECCFRRGALCRCGRSTKKPFCDCYRV